MDVGDGFLLSAYISSVSKPTSLPAVHPFQHSTYLDMNEILAIDIQWIPRSLMNANSNLPYYDDMCIYVGILCKYRSTF